MLLNLLQCYALLRVKHEKLLQISDTQDWRYLETLTLWIRLVASELTKLGTFISPLAILLCVMTGVSSKGASPTRNS